MGAAADASLPAINDDVPNSHDTVLLSNTRVSTPDTHNSDHNADIGVRVRVVTGDRSIVDPSWDFGRPRGCGDALLGMYDESEEGGVGGRG